MDIKERLLQEEIRRANAAPSHKPRHNDYPVKLTLAFILISMIITALMFYYSLENQRLKAHIRACEQRFSPPPTMQPTPVIFERYTIQDGFSDCRKDVDCSI